MLHCHKQIFEIISQTCENERLFPDYQIARQANFLGLATRAIDIIMSGHVVVELPHKGATNPGTFLVDGVQ